MESHSKRLHREAAEQAEQEEAVEAEAARRDRIRAQERQFYIEAEAAVERLWDDLLDGQTAKGAARSIGWDGLVRILDRTWMKEFMRREEVARVKSGKWLS